MKPTLLPKTRCAWVTADPLYIAYHDEEWGRPLHDDRALFELLMLEGMQAGLSWLTVLKKRAHYRVVFDHFDADKIAAYDEKKIATLLQDPGIIRNQLKIHAIVNNARALLSLQKAGLYFSEVVWQYAKQPTVPWQHTTKTAPTRSLASDQLAATLKQRGFKFVGSTICYAFMQAAGIVNDHSADCFCYALFR